MSGPASDRFRHRGQQVTWFAADVDPALTSAGLELVVRRPDCVLEVAGSSHERTHDGVAHVVTDQLIAQLLLDGEEREVGLQFRPCLFRLPESQADRAAEG